MSDSLPSNELSNHLPLKDYRGRHVDVFADKGSLSFDNDDASKVFCFEGSELVKLLQWLDAKMRPAPEPCVLPAAGWYRIGPDGLEHPVQQFVLQPGEDPASAVQACFPGQRVFFRPAQPPCAGYLLSEAATRAVVEAADRNGAATISIGFFDKGVPPGFPPQFYGIVCDDVEKLRAALTKSVSRDLSDYGYAPGSYSGKCRECGVMMDAVDKRCHCCKACAEKRMATALGESSSL